jgi:hypothetical protein
MAQQAERIRTSFSQPYRQILSILIVLGLVGAGGYLAYSQIASVFFANPYLNGFIVTVFVFGVLACFWQVVQVISAVRWIERFVQNDPHALRENAPRIVASLAGLLGSRKARMQLSSNSARSILDSVATRLDESRDITRYIVNLLIFLGLLGTFYGLATTVPAVVETIRTLDPSEGEGGVAVFGRLMGGLEAQLGGMGTAFASSLLGLAGSLVVGLLELFASHGQNRFYRELEEWLSTITKVGFASSEVEGGGFDMDVVAQVLDHMVAQIEALQDLFVQSDERRTQTDMKMASLTASVEGLTGRLQKNDHTTAALEQVAKGQERLALALEAQLERQSEGSGSESTDSEARMRLRSIDVQLIRILEEMTAGRQESVADIRGELGGLKMAVQQAARSSAADPAAVAAQALRTVLHDDFDPESIKDEDPER